MEVVVITSRSDIDRIVGKSHGFAEKRYIFRPPRCEYSRVKHGEAERSGGELESRRSVQDFCRSAIISA